MKYSSLTQRCITNEIILIANRVKSYFNKFIYILNLSVLDLFALTLQWQIDTTSSCRIPQVRKEARVVSRSGAISDLPFFISVLAHYP